MRRPLHLSRRRLGQLLGAGLVGGVLPGGVARAASASERRFIFLYARGGWDPAYVFAPLFDSEHVDLPDGAELAEDNGFSWVSHVDHPAADDFFINHGSKLCLINGVDIPSVAHDRCRKLLMCGASDEQIDDMGAILGAYAPAGTPLPHMVLSGPSYASFSAGSVARLGEEGQLQELLDGSALERADVELALLEEAAQARVDDFVMARARAQAEAAELRGQAARYHGGLAQSFERIADLGPDLGGVVLGDTTQEAQVKAAAELLSSGLCRSVMVEMLGAEGTPWDTHVSNLQQHSLYQKFFSTSLQLLRYLDELPGPAGGSLAEETTVVMISEMGRFPQVNTSGGKDHWTYTSAVLLGAGVRGGHTVGAFDEYLAGQPVDLETGEVSESGHGMRCEDLVATVLALADIDPQEHLPGSEVIRAALAD